MPDNLTASTSSSYVINGFTIATEAKKEFVRNGGTEHQQQQQQPQSTFSYRIPNYRSYINYLDETVTDDIKDVEKLKNLFNDIQELMTKLRSNQFQMHEPIKNLSKTIFDNDLQSIYTKFIEMSKALNDNIVNFISELASKSLQPIEYLFKIENDNEKNLMQLRKNVDKSIKVYETKCNNLTKEKHKQLAKDHRSTDILANEIIEEAHEEKCTIGLRICEYLLKVNEMKTFTCDELTNCLNNYFKLQLEYFNQSMQVITKYSQHFTKLEQYMLNYRKKQELEKEKLADAISTIKTVGNQKPLVNGIINESNNNLLVPNGISNGGNMSSSNTSQSSSSISIQKLSSHSSNNLINGSITDSTYNLHQLQTNRSYGTKKSGYLLKHASRTRMRKHWLKRKCVAENGLLSIYHQDENKVPVILNLITCQMKFVDSKRFKIFSGSNSRVYEFMTESENELQEWISVLNNSKSDSLDKAFRNDGVDESVKQTVNNILRKIKNLDGNDKCCDCGAPEPEWLVTNLGILVCIECCGIHRELGVHISKTQSTKIDRLSLSQLMIARMTGNSKFNKIFESSLDKSVKPNAASNMEARRIFIKLKYEMHKFVINNFNDNDYNLLIQTIKANDNKSVYDMLLLFFAQNVDLMKPIGIDEKKRNILHLVLNHMEETNNLHIVDFIVQNRDFIKDYTVNYQDEDGNTGLHYCAYKNRIESTKILLKANSDYKLKNKDGFTAYDIAYRLTHLDCAKQIKYLLNGNKIENIEWIGLYEEDYLSDTNDDSENAVNRPRPSSMISFYNFMSPSPTSFTIGIEDVDIKKSETNLTNGLNTKTAHAHHRMSSDPFLLNDEKLNIIQNHVHFTRQTAGAKALQRVYELRSKSEKGSPRLLSSRSTTDVNTDSSFHNSNENFNTKLLSASTASFHVDKSLFLSTSQQDEEEEEEQQQQQQQQLKKQTKVVAFANSLPMPNTSSSSSSSSPKFTNSTTNINDQQQQQPPPPKAILKNSTSLNPNQVLFKCKALKTYQTMKENHLSFHKDDMIIVVNKTNRDLWGGYIESQPDRKGFFPSSYVTVYL